MNVMRRMEFEDFFRSPFFWVMNVTHYYYCLSMRNQYLNMYVCLFSIMIHKSDLTSFFIVSIRFIKKNLRALLVIDIC